MTAEDQLWLREAIGLAKSGEALASPNPLVGAIALDAAGTKVGRATTPMRAASTPRSSPWNARRAERGAGLSMYPSSRAASMPHPPVRGSDPECGCGPRRGGSV